MSHSKYKKLSFFAALTVLFGSVVGIGIFFKNASILKENNYNGWGTIISWVIGGVLSLSTAIPYIEMGSLKTKKVHGLPGWAEKACGKKVGYFTKFNYAVFYVVIIVVLLSFFFSESIINVFSMIFKTKQPSILFTFGISLIFLFVVLAINFFSLNAASWVQKITTILKFIPLILVVILGISMVNINYFPNSIKHQGVNLFGKNGGPFSISGVLMALPMVLFSFDAFLGVGSLVKKTKGGEKKVPLIIVVGMTLILVLYLLITISQILHGTGYVSGSALGPKFVENGLFGQIFSPQVGKFFEIFTMIFIAISVYGVINGISMSLLETFKQSVDTDTYIGTIWLKKRYGRSKTILIYIFIVTTFWELLVLTFLLIWRTDAVVDGLSNLPTTLFFIMYGVVIAGYLKNRNKLVAKRISNWLFYTSSLVAIFGILGVVGYQLFYTFTINPLLHPNDPTSLGLFNTPQPLLKWQYLIIFSVFLTLFIGLAPLNATLIRRFRKTI